MPLIIIWVAISSNSFPLSVPGCLDDSWYSRCNSQQPLLQWEVYRSIPQWSHWLLPRSSSSASLIQWAWLSSWCTLLEWFLL